LPASSAAPSPSTSATGSRSNSCSPITAAATAQNCTRSPAAHSASGTRARGALPATNQRQSRTLHPHHARRLGLRRDLPLKQRTHASP
jgi:hypothetical protein